MRRRADLWTALPQPPRLVHRSRSLAGQLEIADGHSIIPNTQSAECLEGDRFRYESDRAVREQNIDATRVK